MKYLYIPVLVAGIIFASYIVGMRMGRVKCHADVANAAAQSAAEMMKAMGEINAQTYRVGVADLRWRLREKYTIAE